MTGDRVLVADDDYGFASMMAKVCRQSGYVAETATTRREALALIGRFQADAALVDLNLGEDSGTDLLREMLVLRPGLPVIVVTAYGDVPRAVAAMRAGASEFVQKPVDHDRLLAQLGALLRGASRGADDGPLPIGSNADFRRVVDMAASVARSDLSVVILGETGVGKEVLARFLHAQGARADGPFVALDCSALPESLIESELFGHERGAFTGASSQKRGLFEMASGGTLFLDEIGNFPLGLQSKLLRAVETRSCYRLGGVRPVRYDARLIAATNTDLRSRMEAGGFRRDLYHRLCEVELGLPPLRERPGDTRLLAEHFIRLHAQGTGRPPPRLGADALEALERYPWPGNVRELKSTLKVALLLARGGDVLELAHLPDTLRQVAIRAGVETQASAEGERVVRVEFAFAIARETGIDLKALSGQAALAAERALLGALLGDGRGTRTRLARRLGIDEKTLRAKLRRCGLATEVTPGGEAR